MGVRRVTAAPPPIVDSHLHFLDLGRFDYPWIAGSGLEFLRDGYLPHDWQADVGELDLLAGVHVQAEVDHATDPVRETAWLATLPEPVAPMAYVAYADLRAPDLDDVLERHRAFAPMRGIRQEAWFDPASTRADLPRENMLLDPAWRAGLARLPEHELSFDLFVWHHQLAYAADVCAALPQLTVIVEHTGFPPLGDEDGMRVWRDGLARFAERVPRSVLKISGLALFGPQWTVQSARPLLLEAIELFGPERCMLGSNYPVDRAAASYADMWAAFDAITAELSGSERTALFSGTALRTYAIEPGR